MFEVTVYNKHYVPYTRLFATHQMAYRVADQYTRSGFDVVVKYTEEENIVEPFKYPLF